MPNKPQRNYLIVEVKRARSEYGSAVSNETISSPMHSSPQHTATKKTDIFHATVDLFLLQGVFHRSEQAVRLKGKVSHRPQATEYAA